METGSPISFTAITAILQAALPLISFLLLICFESKFTTSAGSKIAITLQAFALMATSWVLFQSLSATIPFEVSTDWFRIRENTFTINFYIDQVTALMLFTVNLVSLLVQIFSIEYMRIDKNINRYFAYLGLFTFSMSGILVSSNLVIIYIFWELVGLSSYLLIGFWREKPTAVKAAKKAFIMNRVGDAGFLIAILSLYMLFSTLDLLQIANELTINNNADQTYNTWLLVAGLGIFCGAIGKSAQLPLSSWLPDAMEGPTPVSALIHAATMVAAGVYLLFRCSFLFLPEVNIFIAFTGITTAFAAAFAALSQTDIKKVLAYSTISQLGYMVCAIGTGSPESSMFHLFTHAFFKAGLFLSAGAIIHAIHQSAHQSGKHVDAQDMRHMGGLWHKLPFTAACFAICACALAGLPFFSGFLSKDAILLSIWQFALHNQQPFYWLLPIIGFLTALLTAFYTGRQVFMVFGGKEGWRGETAIWDNLKPASNTFKVPLLILASGSVFTLFSLNPFSSEKSWLVEILHRNPITVQGHLAVALISAFLALFGVFISWLTYQSTSLKINHVVHKQHFIYQLSLKFWHIDNFLVLRFKKTLLASSSFLHYADKKVIDSFVDSFAILQVVVAHITSWFDKYIVDGLINTLTWLINTSGNILRKSTGNQLQSYVSWAVFTSLLIVLLFVINKEF